MSVLEAERLSKQYTSKRLFGTARTVRALDQVSFSLDEGHCLGIVGESGCGKSTLCRVICGIEAPDEGEVRLNGAAIGPRTPGDWRDKIQMVFQDSLDAIDPRFTAADIISEPLMNFTDLKGEALTSRLQELMTLVGLPPEDLQKKGRQFSGGQLQRICIARAMAVNPKVMVLDEPLSSLDVSVQAQILNLLREIKEKTNVSYVIISHDIEAIYYLADSLIVMYAGQIVEKLNDIRDVHSLCHPYSRHLLLPFSSRESVSNDTLKNEESFQDITGCCYAPRCPGATDCCRSQAIDFESVSPSHNVRCPKWKEREVFVS